MPTGMSLPSFGSATSRGHRITVVYSRRGPMIFVPYAALREKGHMEPGVFLAALLIFVGIPAYTVIRIARLRAARLQSPSADVTERLEAVEHRVEDLQQELAETQERLDFAERLLSKAREERRIGS